jgi:hypothetical protein
VVKEMSQEELKAKMDEGDNFSRPPSGTPPTSPEPHRAFYFALEGLSTDSSPCITAWR